MMRLSTRMVRARTLSTAAAELPARVDAVVIGGGCVGASACLHLQERGMSTLLLERHSLTAGTTWHTAGMLWRLRPSYVDIELHGYTRELAMRLEADPAVGVSSWTENGGLFIACNRERLTEYERLSETGWRYGIESSVLSPADAKGVHPLLNVDDVYGALHSPTDGTLDPAGLTQAYTRAARGLGARVAEGVGVTAIETLPHAPAGGGRDDGRRVVAVITSNGQRVETTHVINACGAWANEVAAMVGVQLPLLAMKHAYVVTDAIDGMHGGLPNVCIRAPPPHITPAPALLLSSHWTRRVALVAGARPRPLHLSEGTGIGACARRL
jgi:sarcosine dehydrogenase